MQTVQIQNTTHNHCRAFHGPNAHFIEDVLKIRGRAHANYLTLNKWKKNTDTLSNYIKFSARMPGPFSGGKNTLFTK